MDRLKELAKEHCDASIIDNPPHKASTIPFGDGEIQIDEYEVLDKVTSIYDSTPEKEAINGFIKVRGNHVTDWSLEYKGLKYFPKEVFNLPYLESLHISGESIDEIPEEISNLKKLKLLVVQNTSVSEFPKALYNHKSIRTIDVGASKVIKKVAEELANSLGLKVGMSYALWDDTHSTEEGIYI